MTLGLFCATPCRPAVNKIAHRNFRFMSRDFFYYWNASCLVTIGTYPTSRPGGGWTISAGSTGTRALPFRGAGIYSLSGVQFLWIISTRDCIAARAESPQLFLYCCKEG